MADNKQTVTVELDPTLIYEQMAELSDNFAGVLLTFAESLLVAAKKIAALSEDLREQSDGRETDI